MMELTETSVSERNTRLVLLTLVLFGGLLAMLLATLAVSVAAVAHTS